MSSDSSSDEDAAKFAAVAISADVLHQQAERSKQVAQQRAARARQRRAGGGGILGAVPTDGSDGEAEGESVFLDAAQLRVAEALQQRLQQELEMEEAAAAPAAPPAAPQPTAAAVDNEDSGQVRLFRRVKAGAPVVDRQAQTAAAQAEGRQQPGEGQQQGGWPTAGKRQLDEPSKKRCQAAAVDAADIQQAAEAAAQRAAPHVYPRPNWLPADDDPARWSDRRQRRATKLAAESAAWKKRAKQLRKEEAAKQAAAAAAVVS
ncbi:hypothetical protein C2E21_0133 [Chlorella sorokiniana]|uniref:Uncharacterized protein n=1 Tax=Chlorella sorokiniana TaxID=3076 RepID=A0A2P6U475_CHLSO|nr:hypothetical protein C2E21_0133 [Chlorella sorokiniana]|eukprot:PRW61114.1 hypothetical protein C2E21_0133 [Chlorella sorokiniana]